MKIKQLQTIFQCKNHFQPWRGIFSRFQLIVVMVSLLLTGCDKVSHIPPEELLTMVNEVGEDYGLQFEEDNFDTPEPAILIIALPEKKYTSEGIECKRVTYTEILIEDYTVLYYDSIETLLFSTEDNTLSVFMNTSDRSSMGSNVFSKYSTVTFKTFTEDEIEITVPMGNIVDEADYPETFRYLIYAPKLNTLSPSRSTIDDYLEIARDIFTDTMKEVSENNTTLFP